MYTIVASTTLPYPPDAVFAALASIESTVRWQAGVRGVRRARPGAGDGDGVPPLVLHYWALGARHRLRASVTACEPPGRFAYRAEGDGLGWEATYTVAPAALGCHVTCTLVLLGAPGAAPAARAAAGGETPAHATVRLRRLMARRLPLDLARLEAWVAVQPGARARPAAG